jgi:hypothetical protein
MEPKNVELLENGFRGIQYLIRSTAEPGIPGRTTMPKNTLDTKNGVVLFFLFFFALVLICLAIVGYYCFFCLLLRQHCLRFFLLKATSKSGKSETYKRQKMRQNIYCIIKNNATPENESQQDSPTSQIQIKSQNSLFQTF